MEELAGPDAELWELGLVVTEPGAAAWTQHLFRHIFRERDGTGKMTQNDCKNG